MALINVKQAAELTGLDRQTIINWGHKGFVPIQKVSGVYYVEEETFNNILGDLKEAGNRLGHLEELKKVISDEFNELRKERHQRKLERTVNKVWVDSLKNGFFMMVLNILQEINSINPRQYSIIKKLIDGKNPEDLSDEYGISEEGIRQNIYFTIKKASNISSFKNLYTDYLGVSKALDTQLQLVEELKADVEALKAENMSLKKQINKYNDNEPFPLESEYGKIIRECSLLTTSIFDFELTLRTLNVFRFADINNIYDLCQWNKIDLLKMRNFGKKSLTEVEEFLEYYGLRLGMSTEELAIYAWNNKD